MRRARPIGGSGGGGVAAVGAGRSAPATHQAGPRPVPLPRPPAVPLPPTPHFSRGGPRTTVCRVTGSPRPRAPSTRRRPPPHRRRRRHTPAVGKWGGRPDWSGGGAPRPTVPGGGDRRARGEWRQRRPCLCPPGGGGGGWGRRATRRRMGQWQPAVGSVDSHAHSGFSPTGQPPDAGRPPRSPLPPPPALGAGTPSRSPHALPPTPASIFLLHRPGAAASGGYAPRPHPPERRPSPTDPFANRGDSMSMVRTSMRRSPFPETRHRAGRVLPPSPPPPQKQSAHAMRKRENRAEKEGTPRNATAV